DAEPAGAPPRGEDDRVALARAHEAEPALTLVQATGAGTDVALNPPVVQAVPVLGRDRTAKPAHGPEGRPPASGVNEGARLVAASARWSSTGHRRPEHARQGSRMPSSSGAARGAASWPWRSWARCSHH